MDPLVTVAELETYLQHDVDSEVGALAVASASGIVRDYCRWQIAPIVTSTFTLDGNGTRVLSLPTMRLTAVSAVRLFGMPLTERIEWADGGFTWSHRGQLYRYEGWPEELRNIEVDCVHGYQFTPDTVRAVALVLAARVIVNPEGLRSKTVGDISRSFIFETMRGDLSELQLVQLGGYRLP